MSTFRSGESEALKRAARAAYERGQIGVAVVAALPVPLLVGTTFALGCDPRCAGIAGGVLLGLVLVFGWLGGVARRSVAPGLIAGAVPALLPFAMSGCGLSCSESGMWTACLNGSLAGGVAGGVILAVWTARAGGESAWLLAGSGLIAMTAGVLGCWTGGIAGLTALVVGLAGTSAPLAWVLVRRHAH